MTATPPADPMAVWRLIGEAVMGTDGLGDRRGYRQTWDDIDDDIREEIILAVGNVAAKTLEAAGFRLVGLEPTEEMIMEMMRPSSVRWSSDKDRCRAECRAVLAAAPRYGREGETK